MPSLQAQHKLAGKRGTARAAVAFFAALLLSRAPAQQGPAQTASATPQASLATLHGVVRNAATGEPLPRALVLVEGDANAGVLTDGDGRFEIPGIPAGPQAIRVVKPGFRDRPYAAGGLFLEDVAGPAHNVRVSPEMPDLEFTVAPTCSIRGQIDLSTGDRAQGIQVMLFRRMVQAGRGSWVMTASTKTNGDGAYRFAGLADGAYAVATMPAMESEAATGLFAAPTMESQFGAGPSALSNRVAISGYAGTFYPAARDLSAAAKINLANGDQAQANFTLALEPFQPVSIKPLTPHTEHGSAAMATAPPSATVLDQAGHQLSYPVQFDAGTDAFQLMLPDGSYTIAARSQRVPRGGDSGFVESPLSQYALAGALDFSVAGRPVAGLSVPLSPPLPGSLQLTVRRNAPGSGATKDRVDVLARQTTSGASDGITLLFAQDLKPGANVTADLPPGSYWLQPVLSGGLCEQSFTAGGANLAHEPLAIGNSGSSPPLELTLRDDCAQLKLELPPALAASPTGEEPSYTVYVVPDFETTVDLAPVTLHPSYNGSFTVQNLAPGAYHVFTFRAPVQLEYRNPSALGAVPNSGQAITLAPGSTSNLVLEVPEH